MKILENRVTEVSGNVVTYSHVRLLGGIAFLEDVRLELENPRISAINSNGNDVNVELKDLEGSSLYNKKFINKKENLMFKGKNLYFVLTFDSKSVFTSKPLIVEGYTPLNPNYVESLKNK